MPKVTKVRGKWQLDYVDLLGRRRRRVAKVQTKTGAERQLRKILERQETGGLDGDRIRFKAYAKQWLKHRQPHLKSNTFVTYKGQVENYLLNEDYGLGGYPLTRITRPVAEEFKADLHDLQSLHVKR